MSGMSSILRTRNPVRIGLLWHSPNSGNLGVGALTVSHIALIDTAAARAGVAVELTILGYVDAGAPVYVDEARIGVVALNGRALLPGGGYSKILGSLDLVLDIGGGDSFADIYGWKRFAYLLTTKAMARARGIPLVLAPQTIGPFSRQPYRALATVIMRSARVVVARDPQSYDAARDMSGRIAVMQAIDVAFALPFEKVAKSTDGKVRVGVNPSGLLFNRGYSGANEFGMELDYPTFTRQLLDRLFAEPNVEVWLLSHVNSDMKPTDDDRSPIATLQREYPAARIAPRFISPSEAKSFISGLDFLVAGRMHACIAAYSAGVPVVPVSYSRKFSGLFEAALNYNHVLPVRGLNTDAALEFTMQRFRDRASLVEQIAHGQAIASAKLETYVAYLENLLGKLGAEEL